MSDKWIFRVSVKGENGSVNVEQEFGGATPYGPEIRKFVIESVIAIYKELRIHE